MNARIRLVTVALPLVLALGACATTAPPSPLLTKAEDGLQSLRSDPQVTQWAPDELKDAEQAVKDARDPDGGPAEADHLAFMAQKRVEIAKASAFANREEAAFEALIAKRDAIGTPGGNDSITTLSQNVIGTTPPPIPIGSDAQNGAPAPASRPKPVARLRPSPPIPAPHQQMAQRSTRVPAQAPQPDAVEPAPSHTDGDSLLSLQASDFKGGSRLTPSANRAVHSLLTDLVQQPSRTVLISGASRAQLEAVRHSLSEVGVPEWRLRMQVTSAPGVSVDFGGQVSTPSIR